MSKVKKVEIIREGLIELLKSEEIQAEVKKQAESVANSCGEGYGIQSRTYPERKGYVVKPMTREAGKDNLNNNTILKVSGAS